MPPDTVPADEPDVLAHAEGVRRLARSLVRDAGLAEDLAQETLARAIEKPPRAGWPLRAWLTGVARHIAASMGRGERRRVDRERRASRPESVPSAADAVSRVEEQRRLLEAVLALDEDARVAVVLRFFEGMPPRAIAKKLGVPVETVRTRLKRALPRLRARLEAAPRDRRSSRAALLAIAGWKPSTWVVVPGVGAIAMKKVLLIPLLIALLGFVGIGFNLTLADRGATPRDVAPQEIAAEVVGGEGLAAAKPRPERIEGQADVGPDVDLEAADRDRDLFGVVVQEDGSPVPGADVRTRSYPRRRVFDLDYVALKQSVEGPSARTSRSGAFRLPLRRGDQVNLTVSAPGFAKLERPDCLAGGRLRIVMRPAARLVVTVRDLAGALVPGADVSLGTEVQDGDVFCRLEGRTDAEGRAVFEEFPGPATIWLRASAEGHGETPSRRVEVPRDGEAKIDLQLPAGRTITGRVTDARTHAPLAGVRVGVGPALERPVVTDADGRYALRGWTGVGESKLHALAAGYGRGADPVGTSSSVDFALEPGDVVVGRLVGVDGRAVVGARVSAIGYVYASRDDERMCVRIGESGPEGRFQLSGLRHDLSHSLIVMSEGLGRTLIDFDPPSLPGGIVDVGSIALAPGRRVEGRVVDTEGVPQPGVRIDLRGANADRGRLRSGTPLDFWYGSRESAWTDDLGRFRFRDLAPGAYSVSARPRGADVVETNVEVRDVDAMGVELRLTTGRPLSIRVVDGAGAAVADATVTLTDVLAGTSRRQTRSRIDGVATFVVPRPAAVRALVLPPPRSRSRAFLPPDQKQIEASESESTITLRDAGVVSGRVLDEDDHPVDGVELIAVRDGKSLSTEYANAEGRFEVVIALGTNVDLVLGRHRAVAGAPANSVQRSPYGGSLRGVSLGSEGLVLRASRLSADRRLRVIVVDPDGRPAAGVSVTPGSEEIGAALTDSAGIVEWTNLVGRDAWVSVWPGSRSAGAGRWLGEYVGPVVPDGQTITVRLREGVKVSGTVLRPDGTPVPRAQVVAHSGSDARGGGTTGEDGAFTMLLDPAKFPVSLRVTDPADRTLEATRDDLSSGTTGLVLRLARAR